MGAPKGNQYAVGHHEGRPREYTDERIEEEARLLIEWMQLPESKYFKTFAISRGYVSQRLYEFAERNKVFAETWELAKEWQECRLVNLGLDNKVHFGMASRILAHAHGISERPIMIMQGAQRDPAIDPASINTSKDFVNGDKSSN